MGRRAAGFVLVFLVSALAPLLAGAAPLPKAALLPSVIDDAKAALEGLVAACAPRDALDDDIGNGAALPYRLCDDGPSVPGLHGIPVPAAYHPTNGDVWTGLPAPANLQEVLDAQLRDDVRPEPPGDRVTLDVDVGLPPSNMTVPPGGFPLLLYFHGGAGTKAEFEATTANASDGGGLSQGEAWHRGVAWFASRGYVVVSFSQRFGPLHDSTATLQVSRRYDVNDGQFLLGLLADHDARARARGAAPFFHVDPQRIAATGFSSGTSLTWMLVEDNTWASPQEHIPMRLAVAVPYAGFTDMGEVIAPSGHSFDRDPLTGADFLATLNTQDALSRRPVGVLKPTFLIDIACGADPGLIFQHDFDLGCKRLHVGEPYLLEDPLLQALYDRNLEDRSAYYQTGFYNRVAQGLRVPLFAVQGWTDPITPPIELLRIHHRILSLAPSYPMALYVGDVGHYADNKLKEWADLCGANRHVCDTPDYTRAGGSLDFDAVPGRVAKGVATRINDFLDDQLRGRGPRTIFDVSSAQTKCTAGDGDAGSLMRAASWRRLGPEHALLDFDAAGQLLTSAAPDPHGLLSDPMLLGIEHDNGLVANVCSMLSPLAPGPGVVQVETAPLAAGLVMRGLATVHVDYDPLLPSVEGVSDVEHHLAARLYDVAPDNVATLVTRGLCRASPLTAPDRSCKAFDLFGNDWTFANGHRVLLELTQKDATFLRPDNLPSAHVVHRILLDVPSPTAQVSFRGAAS